ncbi:MAG: Ig-like domain-containing protein [Candidatus Parcubacteria bacterium]|nr:Ig-like domain-containing protein [Candidatus Parcubacteria bacterium]
MKKSNKNLIVVLATLVFFSAFGFIGLDTAYADAINGITHTDVNPSTYHYTTFKGVPVYRLHITNSGNAPDTLVSLTPTPVGDVVDTLVTLHFYNDVNDNGIVDSGDTDLNGVIIATGVNYFTSDNTKAVFTLASPLAIPVGVTHILITADGGPAVGNAQIFTLSFALSTDVTMGTVQITPAPGANMPNTGVLTVSDTAPSLAITNGASDPIAKTAVASETGVAVKRLTFTAQATSDSIASLSITPAGTENDAANIASTKFYIDSGTTPGAIDGTDIILSTTPATYTGNNTETVFTFLSPFLIPGNTAVNILYAYNLGAGVVGGNTLTAQLVETTDAVAGSGITVSSNSSGVSSTITIAVVDVTPPTVTIVSDKTTLKKNETAAITFTLSESSVNFASGDVSVAGGLLSAFAGSGTSYTATFTPTDNSTTLATIDVATPTFTDAAGNPNTAATQKTMTVDTIAPTVTVTMSDVTLTVGETAVITFTFSEAPTGFTTDDVTVANGTIGAINTTNSLIQTATYTPTNGIEDALNIITVGTIWTDTALNTGVEDDSPNYTINTISLASAGNTTNTITIFKQVINDSGGKAKYTDFPLFINGNPVFSGQSVHLDPGTYIVTETNLLGYTRTFTGNCDANGQINHGGTNTHNNICTVVNNDIGLPLFVPVPPLIDVVKVPNPLSLPAGAGPVTYTYTVRNLGVVPMTDVTLVGDTCVPVVLAAGDNNGNAKLDINETWIYRCSTTLSATHTNTVVATGWANGINAVDVANATVVVGLSVVPPLIHVTTVPNLLILPVGGGKVTYTYTVTNPGIVPLSKVIITDDKCTGLPGRISGSPGGDLNKNNLLESNETWSFTCKTNLIQTTTNTGTVVGSANGFVAIDFALATVVVTPLTAIKIITTNIPVVTMGCSGGNLFNISSGQPCVNNVGNANQSSSFHSGLYNFGTSTLRNGSKGEAVMELQRFLNAKLNLGLVVDGKLGPKTIIVIKKWQKDHGLVADGLIGPKTKTQMNLEAGNE